MRKFNIQILQLFPPRMSDVATVLWEIQKVIFISIIHTYFWLFTLSQKKTNWNPLATPPENVTTLTCELKNFFYPTERFFALFQTLEALKRARFGLTTFPLDGIHRLTTVKARAFVHMHLAFTAINVCISDNSSNSICYMPYKSSFPRNCVEKVCDKLQDRLTMLTFA